MCDAVIQAGIAALCCYENAIYIEEKVQRFAKLTQHFEKAVIGWKHGFRLGYLPELTVKAFNRVGRIYQPPKFLRKLEISAEICPVIPPRLRNLRIFLVPVFCKRV